MKKILLLFLTLLVFLLCGMVSTAETNDMIRVGLTYSSAEAAAELSSEKGLQLCTVQEESLTKSEDSLQDYGEITLTLKDGKILITDPNEQTILTLKGDGTECITSAGYEKNNDHIRYNGTAYRGGIIPYINSSGQMNIINFVSLDNYVKGVLEKEISHSSNLEALKAQAVTARSYAAAHEGAHSSQGFDLCATSHCQNYIGVNGEYTSINAAVEDTAGQLLYYNDEPVAGYYFANSGGYTENSEDVWTTAQGYLRGIRDEYSPEYTWTETFTQKELTEAFASNQIGTVQSISIDRVNDSGYVASITVTGSDGMITFQKDRIRSAFLPIDENTLLRSRMFTIDTEGGSIRLSDGSYQESNRSPYYAIASAGKSLLGNVFHVLSSVGSSSMNLNDVHILNGSGELTKPVLNSSAQNAQGTVVYLDDEEDTLILNGRGYGHGVGMSQQGAIEMGRRGKTYLDILHYYYTDIEVK